MSEKATIVSPGICECEHGRQVHTKKPAFRGAACYFVFENGKLCRCMNYRTPAKEATE